jgi:4-amino-4-deoxy-L-arabinose transferase-like glycosyltransferase
MRRLRKSPFAARLLALTGLGLAVRLVYALVVMHGEPIRGDGREFHLLANVLADTGSYLQPFLYLYQDHTTIPTAEKPPLYPLVLALPSALGLDTNTAHQVVSCLMGAAAVGLIGLLGRRVGGDRVGIVAAAMASVYPALVMLDSSLRSESLYVPLVTLSLLAAYRLVDAPGPRRAALLGLAIGLAALTRGEAVLLLALVAVPVLWLVPRPGRLRLAAAVAAGFLVVVGPWLARNWITFNRPAAISTNEGGLIAGANCRSAYYTDLIGTWACFPKNDPAWGTNEAVVSSHLRRRGLDYAGDNADRVPAVVGVRVMRVWDVWSPREAARLESGLGDRHIRAQHGAVLSLYLLVPLAIAGLVALRRRGRPLRILIAPLVLVTLVAATTYGSTRFRAAAEPAIVVLASVALVGAWERRR